MKNCLNCGALNQDNDEFCQNCGANFLQQAQQTMNAYPQQFVSQEGVSAEINPAIALLKRLGSSGLFLFTVIIYSISTILSFLNSFIGSKKVPETLRNFGLFEGKMPDPLISTLQTSFSILLSAIPGILICVGLWMIYVSAKDRESSQLSATGFSIIKVITIIQTVIFGVIYIGLVIIITLVSSLVTSLITDVDMTATYIAVVCVALGVIFGLIILYFVKLILIINRIIKTIKSGQPTDRIPVFVPVVNYIVSPFVFIAAFSADNPLMLLTNLLNGLFIILIAVQIFSVRKHMKSLYYAMFYGNSVRY